MPKNVLKLIRNCSLFTEATIETDMAKRIMLSVIPSVMTKNEMHQFGGFDYKALKAAVFGARDLIKYGSAACVEEMKHYGDNDKDEDYGKIQKAKKAVLDLWGQGKYKECLKLCDVSFHDTKNWNPSYGREAWGKIARTLYQMVEQWERLTFIRGKMNEPRAVKASKTLKYAADEFTAKQKVRCINNTNVESYLTLGGVYEIENYDAGAVKLKGIHNNKFSSYRFAPVAEAKNKKVKCIDSKGTKGNLMSGKVYTVLQDHGGNYSLQGVDGTWKKDRFEEISKDKPEMKKEDESSVIKKVKCINNAGASDILQEGKVYEVVKINSNNNQYQLKVKDNLKSSAWWDVDRFEDVSEKPAIKKVICIDHTNMQWALQKGKVYEVIDQKDHKYRIKGTTEVEDEWFDSDRFKDINDGQSSANTSPAIKKVICIDPSGQLQMGKVYEVIKNDPDPTGNHANDLYTLKGIDEEFFAHRFKDVDNRAESTPKIKKKIVCINDSGYENVLEKGKTYEVSSEDEQYYWISSPGGAWAKYRFKVVDSEKSTQPTIKYVKCIDDSDSEGDLELGKVYEVVKENSVSYWLAGPPDNNWFKKRFELATFEEIEKLKAQKTTTEQPVVKSKPIIKQVKCINPSGSNGHLKKDLTYNVIDITNENSEIFQYTLDGLPGKWLADRFEDLIKDEPATTKKKHVKCISSIGSNGALETGKIYEVIDYSGGKYKLKGVSSTWSKQRFVDADTTKKYVKCISAPSDKLTLGKIYEVEKEDTYNYWLVGQSLSWPKDNFELIGERSKTKAKYVRCINNHGFESLLQLGEIYKVDKETKDTYDFKDVNGRKLGTWSKTRFEVLDAPAKEEQDKQSTDPPANTTKKKYVKCIDTIDERGYENTDLELGKVYEVEKEHSYSYSLKGLPYQWPKGNFEITDSPPQEQDKPETSNEQPTEPPAKDNLKELETKMEGLDGSHLLDFEVETMKEIVVLMNVFDGLAHNTASVMPKVVGEELKDWKKKYPNSDISQFSGKYKRRVQDLMDSKEIDDPMTVYKQVQDIVESPENKHIYRDWITKIRNAPDYQNTKLLKNRRQEIAMIKIRKEMKERLSNLVKSVDHMADLKDAIINSNQNIEARKVLIAKFNNAIVSFQDALVSIKNAAYDMQQDEPSLKDAGNTIYSAIQKENSTNELYRMSNRLNGHLHDQESYSIQTINSEIVNAMYKIRRFCTGLGNLIEKCIG